MTDTRQVKSGMTEEEIMRLADPKNNHPKFRGAPYWTAEIYSFGKYIRQYGFYPSFLPLAIYTDHGPGRIVGQPYKFELETDAPVMFYHSPASVEIWKRFSAKPCFVLYSPPVFYRRRAKIVPAPGARGTIAFPTHSSSDIEELSDMGQYIDQLKSLPAKFQPVSVCLHITDIRKGRHKIFMNKGLPVFTAGGNDGEFIERFYDILKNFSYATSNLVGSVLYYAVEIGIPFFIYGNKPLLMNRGDVNVPLGVYDFYHGHEHYQAMHKMFSNLDGVITPAQKKLVETDLGLYDGISRQRMSFILYTAFFKWLFSAAFIRWLAGLPKKLRSQASD